MKPTRHGMAFGLIYLTLFGIGSAAAAAESGGVTAAATAAPTPAAAAKDDQIRNAASQMIGKRRLSLDKEAIAANDEILHAILDIEKKDTKGAFKMLEKADGQLTVILARDPHLKLAPINVRAGISDLESSPDAIHHAVKDAQSALDQGQIQSARALLSPLVSEMRIYTDYLPLEFYPDAIKRASREIQESKLKAAETTLADAMGSIVTTEDIIPLPPLKAEGDVVEAEQLLNKDKVKDKDQALSLLKSADVHLANANALGYGKYQDIRGEITSIEAKVEGGAIKPDLFARVKHFFHEMVDGQKA
jgi:hypothetical protein